MPRYCVCDNVYGPGERCDCELDRPCGCGARAGSLPEGYALDEEGRAVPPDGHDSTRGRAASGVPYDRPLLLDVLVLHQRRDASGCYCGWAVLGTSYAAHVADAYEAAARGRRVGAPR